METNKRKRESKSINEKYEIIRYYEDLLKRKRKMQKQIPLNILN
jgi:hypothetical protein